MRLNLNAVALAAALLAAALLIYIFGLVPLMSALVLAILGAVLGWVGSLVTARRSQRAILLDILTGAVGAFLGLLVFGGGSLTEGGPVERVLSAVLGSVLLIFVRGTYLRRPKAVHDLPAPNRLEPHASARR